MSVPDRSATSTQPRISVVTPSFNQGQYIEQTILSVIGQQYPDIEYVILDGGSTDNTIEIIRRYERQIAYWSSEPDEGQSHAINRGFAKATGDILCWLNSDDILLPGALQYIARQLDVQRPHLLYGNCLRFTEGKGGGSGSDVIGDQEIYDLALCDYIQQPSAAWTRKAWDVTGPLDQKMTYAFDWDWFIRAERARVQFDATHRHLSVYRFHSSHKTGTGGAARTQELATIYRRHSGERFETFFLQCVQHKGLIGKLLGVIFRLRLVPYEGRILRLALPTIFGAFSDREITSVLVMVPNLAPGHLR